jgi:serine/threonine-protein kinase RsbW
LRRAPTRSPAGDPDALHSHPERERNDMTVASEQRWTIASDVNQIAPIVAVVSQLCAEAGFSDRLCRLNVPVALTEAIANAIIRGNAGDPARIVHIHATLERELLVLEVTDEGDGFDLDGVRYTPHDDDWLEREDGRGVFLMRQLMDEVESCPPTGNLGHTVRLRLRRA